MATVYKFKVKCVSVFCAYTREQVAKIIEEALKKYKDPETGLRLESIEVRIIVR